MYQALILIAVAIETKHGIAAQNIQTVFSQGSAKLPPIPQRGQAGIPYHLLDTLYFFFFF